MLGDELFLLIIQGCNLYSGWKTLGCFQYRDDGPDVSTFDELSKIITPTAVYCYGSERVTERLGFSRSLIDWG